MPIYEYHCPKCDKDFEEIVGVNDPAPSCPSCHAGKTEKLMSRACFCSGGNVGGHETGGGGSSRSCSGCSGGSCASCH